MTLLAMMKKTILAAAVVGAISTGMVGSTMTQAFAADIADADGDQGDLLKGHGIVLSLLVV